MTGPPDLPLDGLDQAHIVRVRVNLTEADLAGLAALMERRPVAPVTKEEASSSSVDQVLWAGLFAVAGAVVIFGRDIDPLELYPPAIAVSAAIGLLLLWRRRQAATVLAAAPGRPAVAEPDVQITLKPKIFEASPDGARYIDETGEVGGPWSEVTGLTTTDQALYVLFQSGFGLIVPVAAFPDDDARAQFAAKVMWLYREYNAGPKA